MQSRMVAWLVEGERGGEGEIVAYAAGSLIGIAVATVVLAFVVGVSLVGA